MLAFTTSLILLIITPGPGVLTTAGIGSSYGYSAGLRFLVGLCIGTNLTVLAVVTGIAAAILAVPVLRTVLLLASAAYLLYLAFRVAYAGSRVGFIRPENPPGIMTGIMLQLVNPKAYAVNTTLFSGFPFWPENLPAETAMKFLIMNVVWVPVHLGWLWAGVYLRRLGLPEKTQFAINILMAIALVLVVGLAILSHL
ncbi:MAG: LysE family transporter [Pseudomonadota bacterium]